MPTQEISVAVAYPLQRSCQILKMYGHLN